MPVWHEKTKQYVDDGKLVVLGVIQEQHAERCRLYAQWKGFDFPILQDQFTENAIAVVPVPIFIDEHGIVRNTRPKTSQLDDFINAKFEPASKSETESLSNFNFPPASEDGTAKRVPLSKHLTRHLQRITEETIPESILSLSSDDLCLLADYVVKWKPQHVGRSIELYEKAIASRASDSMVSLGQLHFRLGVAYRQQFDSDPSQHAGDFALASENWSKALEQNPNQYIWRRRIQQYGPRLSKPYPFYDWVSTAISEISERGETPVQLTVALAGAEIANRSRTFTVDESSVTNPDPDAKITLDSKGLVDFHSAVVPQKVSKGKTARVHLIFKTSDGEKGKWNNEGQPMAIWMNESKFFKTSKQLLHIQNAEAAASNEVRSVDFEIQTMADSPDEVELKGFALYNVCTADNGQCLFRRLEFSIPIQTLKPKKSKR